MTVVKRYNHRTGKSYVPGSADDPNVVPEARSDLPTPHVISDVMDGTMNHADGKMYDSKSEYERAVKAAGCEIVGNDSSIETADAKIYHAEGMEQSISDAIEQHESGTHHQLEDADHG